uniref:Uncharacterized protein n=1 Tax=Desertifilum tharense IPPAS B-1220 TaxID=1781255 RepID=A0ACD5GUA1_9CYAN
MGRWGDGGKKGWVNTDLLLYFSALREALSSPLGTPLLGIQALELPILFLTQHTAT